ncbi:MAG: hypothetical protein JEY91_09810 [Spirochaetaceae bacterium]|nr:hypothetical protein [Spirochaetaceae bacterium]
MMKNIILVLLLITIFSCTSTATHSSNQNGQKNQITKEEQIQLNTEYHKQSKYLIHEDSHTTITTEDLLECKENSIKIIEETKDALFSPIEIKDKFIIYNVLVYGVDSFDNPTGIFVDKSKLSMFSTYISLNNNLVETIEYSKLEPNIKNAVDNIFYDIISSNDIITLVDQGSKYFMVWTKVGNKWGLKSFNLPPKNLTFKN